MTIDRGAGSAPASNLRLGADSDPSNLLRALGWALALSVATFTLSVAPLRWAALAVTGAVLVTAIVLRPPVGLIVLAFLIPFGPALSFSFESIGAIDLLVALTVAAWLVLGLSTRRLVLKRTQLLWPMAAFLWFAALSLLRATSWQQGGLEWLKWAEFAAVYVVAANMLERRHVRWVLIALFSAAIVEVALGAYQFSQQVGPQAFALAGNFERAYGTLQQPNPYAGYLGYLMPIALSLAIGILGSWWRTRKRSTLLAGLLLAAVTLALLTGIGLSWSRGAWLGAVAAVLVVILCRNQRTLLIGGALLLTLFLILLLIGPARLSGEIWQRAAALGDYFAVPDPTAVEITDQNFSVLERIAHWQAGVRMFDSAPWTGVGIGNYGVAYPQFALPHWYAPLGHAHNLYINFLAETGILGAAAFFAFWISAAVLIVRRTRAEDVLLKSLALGLLGTLVYLSVHNMFDNLFVQHLQLQLALLLGAIAALAPGTPRLSTQIPLDARH